MHIRSLLLASCAASLLTGPIVFAIADEGYGGDGGDVGGADQASNETNGDETVTKPAEEADVGSNDSGSDDDADKGDDDE